MQAARKVRLGLTKSRQPTPEARMTKLARLRRKQRLLLVNRKFEFPPRLAGSTYMDLPLQEPRHRSLVPI